MPSAAAIPACTHAPTVAVWFSRSSASATASSHSTGLFRHARRRQVYLGGGRCLAWSQFGDLVGIGSDNRTAAVLMLFHSLPSSFGRGLTSKRVTWATSDCPCPDHGVMAEALGQVQ